MFFLSLIFRTKQNFEKNNKTERRSVLKGFTLVELMVSVSIFAFMTTFLLSRYGTFNQGVFLTNLAYDIAISVRSAQAYGLNVRDATGGGFGTAQFNVTYGLYFNDATAFNKEFLLFYEPKTGGGADNLYDSSNGADVQIQKYAIKRNIQIDNIILGQTSCISNTTEPNNVTISFTRPNPEAVIKTSGSNTRYNCATIILRAPDDSTTKVIVRETGQISVEP